MRITKAFYSEEEQGWKIGLLTEGGSVLVCEQTYSSEEEANEALAKYEMEVE